MNRSIVIASFVLTATFGLLAAPQAFASETKPPVKVTSTTEQASPQQKCNSSTQAIKVLKEQKANYTRDLASAKEALKKAADRRDSALVKKLQAQIDELGKKIDERTGQIAKLADVIAANCKK